MKLSSKLLLLSLCLTFIHVTPVAIAAPPEGEKKDEKKDEPKDKLSVTQHTATCMGKRSSTQPRPASS